MADFDPDAYLAATQPTPATAFDPDAYLKATSPAPPIVQPSQTEPSQSRESVRPTISLPNLTESLFGSGGAFVGAAQREAERLIPKTFPEAGQLIAGATMPFLEAPRAISEGIGAIEGKPQDLGPLKQLEDIKAQFGGGSTQYQEAAGRAAGQILPQMAMLALPKLTESLFGRTKPEVPPVQTDTPLTEAAAAQPIAKEGIPDASQITSTEGVPVPEIRQEVGGGTPLRQQGEIAAAREGGASQAPSAAPQEPVAPTVPQPEQPFSDLLSAAQSSKNPEEFIGAVQKSAFEAENRGADLRVDHGLLTKINDWANLPENADRFKNTGWFGIASKFYEENKGTPVSEAGQPSVTPIQPKEVAPTAETPTTTGEVTPQGQAAVPVAVGGSEPPIIGKDVTKNIPDFPRDKTIGLTQDFISKDREARGEEPLAKQARQTNPETWDKSAQVFQGNPNAGHELVADLIRNPRPISQDDLGVLLRHRVNLTNETDLNFQRLTDPNSTPSQKGDALTKLAALRDARNDADTAVQTQGSTTGRTLQFLKSLSDQDYSLSGIGQQRIAAMGGKELSPVEHEQFTKENAEWSREILEKDAALQDYLKTNARQESALKSYKTRLKTAITETERRLAFSDYAPEIRRQMELDPEAVKLKGEADAVKQRFQEQLLKDQLSNRPWWQKVLGGVAWAARESALSGYHTLEKLAGFTGGQLVRIPMTQAAERVWGMIPGFRDIAAQSEFGPGASARALGKLYSTFFRTAFDQAKKLLTTGKTDYTMNYEEGKRPMQYPSFFGRMHGIEKYPLREGSTAMNRQRIVDNEMEKLSAQAVSQGHDITDPIIQASINKLSSDAGLRDILMNNNLFADKIQGIIRSMEGKQKATGEPSVELNVMAALAKTFLTKGIVRTPANFVTQVFEHSPIGLARGLSKAARANYVGVENIPAAQRTAIMRLMGVGSVGSAMWLWGALDALRSPEKRIFGGYYQPGEKRDAADVKFASVRLAGVTGPHYLTHNLLTEPAQMANTMMRVAVSALSKKDRTNKGLVAGALASTIGLAEQAPIANPAFRMGKLTDPRQQTSYFADLVRGLIPQLVQNIAMDMDKSDVQRKPSGLVDTLKLGIPGLRQTVPEKTVKPTRAQKQTGVDITQLNP